MNNQLSQCTITLNRACNLRCNFCYAKNTGYNVKNSLNFNNIKRIVDLSKEAGIQYIVLTGGEPTLYNELFDVVKYIKLKGLKPTIATNGISFANLEFCKKIIDSGIEYIDISVKGFNSKSYVKTTGIDGYEKCLKAISNLSMLGANFNCSMVLTSDNIENFCSGVEDIFFNKAKSVSFTFEIDNESNDIQGIAYLKEKKLLVLIDNFFSQIHKLDEITKGEWWIEYGFPLCMYNERQLKLLKNKLAKPCQIIEKSGITFDEKMNLIPCNMFYDVLLGQFDKDFSTFSEFKNYVSSSIYNKKFNKIVFNTECLKCRLYNQCGGGCPIYWKHFSVKDLFLYKEECLKIQ